LELPDTFYLDESGSGLLSEVGSGSGPNRSGSATLGAKTEHHYTKYLKKSTFECKNTTKCLFPFLEKLLQFKKWWSSHKKCEFGSNLFELKFCKHRTFPSMDKK
jgi:hypothetical protein